MAILEAGLAAGTNHGVGALVSKIWKHLPNNDKQIEKAYRDIVAQTALELDHAFHICVNYLIDKHCETVEQLDSKLDMESTERLFWKLFPEAVSSTTRERTKMLCAALAGATNPDIDAETKSRVARAIVQLEPSDIKILKRHHDQFGETTIRGNLSHFEIVREDRSRQALVLAGCVEVDEDDDFSEGLTARVTKLGVDVLDHLSAWKPEADAADQEKAEGAGTDN